METEMAWGDSVKATCSTRCTDEEEERPGRGYWAGWARKRERRKQRDDGLRPVPSFSSFAILFFFFQGIKEREEKREK